MSGIESTDVLIAKAMLDHLNKWTDKPCIFRLDELSEKSSLCMSMQQLSGSVIKKKYINGSFIGSFPFSVVIRQNGIDQASRIKSTTVLNSLANWLGATDLPDLGEKRTANEFEMTSSPSMIMRSPDGIEDYQAVFQLEYKQKGGK